MFARFWSTAFKSSTLGWMTCLRLNMSNWRVKAAARRAASEICFKAFAVERVAGAPGEQAIRIPLDDGEDVVEIVGDARGQLADGLQLLGMAELGLQIEHVRNVRPVTVDDLAGDDREEGPGDGPAVEVDLFPQLLLAGGQTVADDVRGVRRQNGQQIVLVQGLWPWRGPRRWRRSACRRRRTPGRDWD